MIEIRIHGRGGQGGVTLAKMIAAARFRLGESVQAFGIYAAERSGAPLQAFCRYDREPINNRNLIYEPDHVIVLDPTLIAPAIASGLKPGGWILLNTPDPPESFAEMFPTARIAVIDATAIARENDLGSKSVPIVNTAMVGAAARLLDMKIETVHEGLEHLGFVGNNLIAAKQAFECVTIPAETAAAAPDPGAAKPGPPMGRVDVGVGSASGMPAIRTGQWATQQPHRHTLVPPCNHICPAGNDVQGFLQALARKETDLALATLLRTTPFPGVCGRVCPAPCMEQCNRIELDGAVNVRDLERYAADHGKADLEPEGERPETVAVIGSGPGGLAAAFHLGKLGYRVRLYESGPTLGGLLRTGIPEYRLPREILDEEIGRIIGLGIDVHTDQAVDRKRLVELASRNDAVLVATGLQQIRSLQLGSDNEAVSEGIEFLDRANRGEIRVDGETIVVVGGGNTALDAARTALRLGAKSVKVVYRRSRDEMPAIAEEIEQGVEEGVILDTLVSPVRIVANGGAEKKRDTETGLAPAHRLVCRRMELGEPDESGRRRPIEVPDTDFEVECDRVLLALGQGRDLSVLPEGTEIHDDGKLVGMLEKPIFATGDLATNEGTVAAAIGAGRRAALHIHQLFTGEQRLPASHAEEDVVRSEGLRMHLFERQAGDHGASLSPQTRRSTFDEVHHGLDGPEEAERCLSCGVCNECDRCVTYCPEGVLKRDGHDFVFDYSYCKGCGVCSAECPRSVVFMTHL